MILAQFEHIIVHETRITSGPPWHIYGAAVLAGLIAIVGWIVAHRTSQNRDLVNWQRTALLTHISKLIQLSSDRNRLLLDHLSSIEEQVATRRHESEVYAHLLEMQAVQEQMELLNQKELQEITADIVKLHFDAQKDSDNIYWRNEYEKIDKAVVNTEILREKHKLLSKTFHHATSVRKFRLMATSK